MDELLVIVGLCWVAGLASFVGGAFARLEHFPESETKAEYIHGIVAFGGGILMAAVAFALAPKGMEALHPAVVAGTFCVGGIAFCGVDAWITSRGGSKAQFMAMLMDFVPEAIALGAVFAHERNTGVLLALFIGAQNLPEGFNAYRESVARGVGSKTTLLVLLAASLLGPLSGGIGFLFFQNCPLLTAGIMSFAAGGILYLIFQDIAPQSTMRPHWLPPLGAVLGFTVGMVGKQVLG